MDPLVLLFYFHLGEAAFIVPVVMIYGRLFNGISSLASLFDGIRVFSRRQIAWTCIAGLFIAGGYFCYFCTKETIPRPVAYALGCAAGTSVGMLYGYFYFREYHGSTLGKSLLLLLAAVLYATSITLVALSMS